MNFDFQQFDWQTTAALTIVLAAVVVFIRKLWQSASASGSGCGTSCGGCPSNTSGQSAGSQLKVTKLVQLDSE